MPRGNKETLVVPTSEEARKYGSKGGIASAESRKKKKLLREAFKTLLDGKYEIEEGKQLGGYDALATSMIKEALGGNVKAFVAIRDTIGEKPTDTIGFEESENLTGIKIKFVNKSKPNQKKEKDPKIIGEYTPPTNTEEEQ